MKNRSVIPLLLVLLFSYIVAQLFWWAYLITQLTEKVYVGNPKLDSRVNMVWGEGIVFSFLLFLGFIITYKAYRKEIALARQQKNFLLSITHELKTPVASLRLFIETLQSRVLTDEQKAFFLDNALNDTDRLNSLIENILLTSRMEKGDLPLHKKLINLSDLVKTNIQNLESSIGKNHRFHSEINSEIFAEVDQQAIESILINLIDNAVKYSPKDSEIGVKLISTSSSFQLIVSDQGQGIKKEDRKKIFEKFIRIQNEETRSAKGTGLGLYIVSNLVNSHYGKIEVSDNSPLGSVFKVEIPLK